MAKPTITTLFSGIGGVDLGAIAAGFEPCEAVEFDPQLADLHKANIGGKCHVMNILDCDPFKFEKVDLLHASPVCFPKETLVLTEKGLTPIEDIKIGDFVVTHQSRLRRVTNTLSRKAQVLELKGQGHYGLITTHDHPFLSVEKKIIYPPYKERKAGNWCHSVLSEPQWVEASELKGKHWLSLTQYPSVTIPSMFYLGNEGLRGQTFSFSPSFFKVVGLWVGNGWVRYSEGNCNKKNRGEVTISCNKKKVDAMRQDLIDAGIKFHETVKRTAINFSINSRPFCRWLVENFGKLAHGKKIPLWLLGASNEIRSSFFDGYMATDGSLLKRKSVVIGLASTTVSKELAFGMRMLGLTLGYSVTLNKHTPNPLGVIEGRVVNQSPIYSLKYVESERMSYTSTIYRSGCVRGVNLPPESQQVFCLTVDEDESFIADGLVVHNCKSFSTANANKGEKQLDIDCAKKVAEFIQVLQPPTFTLENVQAYGKSKAFNIILEMLYSQGYWVNYQVLNAADFGGIYQCPFHTVNYVQNPYPTATAQVSVEKFATMPSEDQTKHLAWFVAASLVKATKQEYVENVTVQKLLYIAQLLEQRENPTQVGLEVDILMTEGISKSVLTGNISESIDMLLKECLAENSQRQKLSITSMETKQTIVRTIYKCLRITLNTSDIIVQKHDECPLCKRYGVPQSRRRLILIAVKSGYIPPLPPKQKHVGWYAAIADLVHDLPDSQLADWQWKALPSSFKTEIELFDLGAFTSVDPLLIENTGARSDRELQTREADEPCWTLRAMGQDGHYHRANALLENAKIKALDIACLARLQSFPDDYKWTGRKSLDGMGIGNSVPPLMYKAISEILKNV